MTEQENVLLYGGEKQFGIIGLLPVTRNTTTALWDWTMCRRKGITVTRADYDLIYAAPLTEKDTLDVAFMNGSISSVRQIYGSFAVGQRRGGTQ